MKQSSGTGRWCLGRDLSSCKVDNFLLVQITLVAHKHLIHMLVTVTVNLGKPALHSSVTVLISHIVHDNDS